MPLGAQELLSLPGHLSYLSVFRGDHVVRSLVFRVFCKPLFVFYPFSFSHCIVCPSTYGFWLPRWCLQTSLDSSIRHTLACIWYSHVLQQHRLLSAIPLSEGFMKNHHILSFKTFCGRYQHLVLSREQMTKYFGSKSTINSYYVFRWPCVPLIIKMMARGFGSLK